MPSQSELAFIQVWPRCLVIVLGIIELLAVVMLFLTELGNVASNFWTTNVFAGAWCGMVMTVHFLALFVAGCCAAGSGSALVTFVITIIALVACTALISFDAVFLALPTTCILTPSCTDNAASTTLFSYYFRQGFFNVFNKLGPFSSYTESQAKFLFQIVQISVGGLCFILCITYVIIYLISKYKANKVTPSGLHPSFRAPPLNYPQPRAGYPQQAPYTNPTYPNAPSAGPGDNRRV